MAYWPTGLWLGLQAYRLTGFGHRPIRPAPPTPQPPRGNQSPTLGQNGPVSPCSGRSATKCPEPDQTILLRGVTPDFGHSVSPQGILLRRMGPEAP